MLKAATFDELLAVVRDHVDRTWLDTVIATPDGQAQLYALVDIFVELDAADAQRWAQFRLRASSRSIGSPATGPVAATTTLAITRWNPGDAITIGAGARAETSDRHVFATDQDVTFAAGEVGVTKYVSATAIVAGFLGVIPPQEITRWTKVANGITGVGTSLALQQAFTGSPNMKALRFVTDTTKPHPFKVEHVGLPIKILDVDDLSAQVNVGRYVRLDAVNDGSHWDMPATPEDAAAWTTVVDVTADFRYAGWYVGSYGFTWQVCDWSDLGFSVSNTTRATAGRDGMLDEIAKARGRGRRLGEADGLVTARLARKPLPPCPIPMLKACTIAVNTYGFSRHDVVIYELAATAPPDVDLYAENFPACGGYIGDLHCSDASSPITPDGMASRAPDYSTLTPFYNPGPALFDEPMGLPCVVRWDPPSGMGAASIAQVRIDLFAAAKQAKPAGGNVFLYYPQQWGYPGYPLWHPSSSAACSSASPVST